MALTVLAKLAGDDMAKAIQLGIEYDPQPPFDAARWRRPGPSWSNWSGPHSRPRTSTPPPSTAESGVAGPTAAVARSPQIRLGQVRW